jgi:predicted dehydrogenase
MSDSVRYGVVGVGGVGRLHADIVEGAPDATLVAGADHDEETAADFAGKRECGSYTDPGEMVTEADVDAVSVCTPSGTHAEVSIECLEAGASVLCEKPLDVYRDRLDGMVAAADAADGTLAGVFQKRTFAEHQRAKRAIADGELGRIVLGTAHVKWYRSQEYYDSGDWRGTRALDGGCLLTQAIHHVDVLQWLMGGVEGVYASLDTVERDMETENVAAITLAFDNGAIGTIEATTATCGGRSRIEVNGTRGSYNDGTFLTTEARPPIEYVPDEDREFGDAHVDVIRDFVSAIRDDRDPMVPVRDARRAVDIVLASYESAERDAWIDVDAFRNGAVE